MSRDLHLRSASSTTSAHQAIRATPAELQGLETMQACLELVWLDAALPVSSAELDAIELLLGSELKLFTSSRLGSRLSQHGGL